MRRGSASGTAVKLRYVLVVLVLIVGALLAVGYRNAIAEPIVRIATARLADWPRGQTELRVALLSDIHVAGPDMPPARLARIVAQVNALRPDLVLIAGDFTSDKPPATQRYTAAEAVAPLAGLRPPLGVVAVLGNHDHWRDAASFRAALPKVGVTMLANQAITRGPLVIGGVDDIVSGNENLARTYAAMKPLAGARILLSHSPDIVPALPAPVGIVFAGHTHCGQIRLPLVGALFTASPYGQRFACGMIDDSGQRVLVGAGLGTSILPLRLGTPPDIWLVTLGPQRTAG